MSRISDTLNAAADYIERNGWWRNKRKDETKEEYEALFPDGPNKCASLAISQVTGVGTPGWAETEIAFAKFIDPNSGLGNYLDVIYKWNDSHDSGEPVIAKLREAAKELA